MTQDDIRPEPKMDREAIVSAAKTPGEAPNPIEEVPASARPQNGRVLVIINPASGQDQPILSALNAVFQTIRADWDVSVTKAAGDARRLALEAVEAGADVVAACGGDGTVVEVASALAGSNVPLAILPAGTANALALSLDIPTDLMEACALIGATDRDVRAIDIAQMDDGCFLVGVGVGVPGAIAETADRAAKDRHGLMAYMLASLQALRDARPAHYRLVLDGQPFESDAVACLIANAGTFAKGISLAEGIDMSDGLLDVFLFHTADIGAILALAASLALQNESSAPYQHWQAREITIETNPPQSIQADGEVIEPRPLHIRVQPQAVRVIVPQPRP